VDDDYEQWSGFVELGFPASCVVAAIDSVTLRLSRSRIWSPIPADLREDLRAEPTCLPEEHCLRRLPNSKNNLVSLDGGLSREKRNGSFVLERWLIDVTNGISTTSVM